MPIDILIFFSIIVVVQSADLQLTLSKTLQISLKIYIKKNKKKRKKFAYKIFLWFSYFHLYRISENKPDL